MAALEVSYDRDWYRPRLGFFYASGDRIRATATRTASTPSSTAPAFAGGGFSFFNRLGIRLAGTGVALVERGIAPAVAAQQQGRRAAELRESRRAAWRRPASTSTSRRGSKRSSPRTTSASTPRAGREAALPGQHPQTTSAPTSASALRYRPFLNNNVDHRRRRGRASSPAGASKTSTKRGRRCTTCSRM